MSLAAIFLGMIGWPQVVLIAVIVLLLFGGRKIPELMRGLGGGVKEFKDAVKEDEGSSTSQSESKDSESQKKS